MLGKRLLSVVFVGKASILALLSYVRRNEIYVSMMGFDIGGGLEAGIWISACTRRK